MILDGYNKFAEIAAGEETLRIEYRPALRHERMDLFRRCSFLPEDQSRAILDAEIHRRVLCPITLEPESPMWWAVLRCVLGQEPKSTEDTDADNLREGLRIHLQYPGLTTLDCADCQAWWMDPLARQVAQRGGKPLPRPPEAVLLCQTKAGCPKGTPENPKTLSRKNQQALRHYYECHATAFPDDAIVKHNAVLIQKELADNA